jgi:hypothetical protein
MEDISIMRLNPNDQLLDTLIAKAHVVLQLSTRKGFEVKVSEALHAGRPIIATKAGGIPLQVKDTTNSLLVNPGAWKVVAGHLINPFTNNDLYKKMSYAANIGVSDEVSTVGDALSRFYLAAKRPQGSHGTSNCQHITSIGWRTAAIDPLLSHFGKPINPLPAISLTTLIMTPVFLGRLQRNFTKKPLANPASCTPSYLGPKVRLRSISTSP